MNVAQQIAFGHGPLGSSMTGEDGYTSHQVNGVPGMTYFEWLIGQALKASANTGILVPIEPEEMARRAIEVALETCHQLDIIYEAQRETARREEQETEAKKDGETNED